MGHEIAGCVQAQTLVYYEGKLRELMAQMIEERVEDVAAYAPWMRAVNERHGTSFASLHEFLANHLLLSVVHSMIHDAAINRRALSGTLPPQFKLAICNRFVMH